MAATGAFIKCAGQWALALGLLLLAGLPAHAQADLLTQTYTDRYYRAFQFRYGDGWQVTDERLYVTAIGAADNLPLIFIAFQPSIITLVSQRSTDPVTIMARLREFFPFITAEGSASFVDGRPAAIAPAELNADIAGFAVVVRMADGRFGFVTALTTRPDLARAQPYLQALIRSYDALAVPPIPSLAVPQLRDYAANWQTSLRELRALGLVGTAGALVEEAQGLLLEGIGNQLAPLAARHPHRDLIVAATLQFTPATPPEQGYESCSLLLRVVATPAGSVLNYLEIGLDNSGALFYFDDFGADPAAVYDAVLLRDINLAQPVALLLILLNDRMTVYANGVNIADNVLVTPRTGTYGFALRSAGLTARCAAANAWIYRTDGSPAGICQISAALPVNKRAQPDLSAAIIGQLSAAEPAIGYARDATTGLRWWQLRAGGWTREDVVLATGACDALPEKRAAAGQ